MKRFPVIFIIVLVLSLLLSLTACGRVKVSEPYYPAGTSEEAPEEIPVETAPPLSEGAETDSRIAGSFMVDDTGTLYTTIADVPDDSGIVYLYDVLPADTGYVYVFIPSGGIVYAVVRPDMMTLDTAGLYAYDLADGSSVLLADDCSGVCVPILAGDLLYYMDNDGNIRELDLNTGECETVLSDVESLFAAESGFLYYARTDGGVYRNDSTMNAEYRIMDDYSSLQLFVSDSGLCSVGYDTDTSAPVLQFRDSAGNPVAEQTLDVNTVGICQQGDSIYAVQPGGNTLDRYSIADGSLLDSIEFPDAEQVQSLLYVGETAVYYLRLDGGMLSLAFAELSDGASTELGDALAF